MAQPVPVVGVVIVHRRAPAEDVVADEEAGEHSDGHRDEGDAGKAQQLVVELGQRHRLRLGERGLDQVVEGAVPVIDRDADLHLEIGDENDQRRAEDGPVEPGMRREAAPEGGEQCDDHRIVDVEPQEWLGPEDRHADDRRRPLGRIFESHDVAEVARHEEPEQHRNQGPDGGRPEEDSGSGEEGDEHAGRLFPRWGKPIKTLRVFAAGEQPTQMKSSSP